MSAAPSPLPAPCDSTRSSADELMTADRSERKYLLGLSDANAFSRKLDAHLSRHTHSRSQLPNARLYSTTVYFDTHSRHLYQEASVANESVKLRAREYYAVDPSMVQLARRPEELVRFDRVLWFELKHKQGGRVQKRRFGIPKPDVPAFLSNGRITEEMVDVQLQQRTTDDGHSHGLNEVAGQHGDKARSLLSEVSHLCQLYGEPFDVDCIVNYRRVAWQDERGLLRITLDRDVRFFPPPSDVWTRSFALTAETLGRPAAKLGHAIIEVKSRGTLPAWLESTLEATSAEASDFSKFVAASSHVHNVA